MNLPEDAIFSWFEPPHPSWGTARLSVKFSFIEGAVAAKAVEWAGRYRVYFLVPRSWGAQSIQRYHILTVIVPKAGSKKERKRARVFIKTLCMARFPGVYHV